MRLPCRCPFGYPAGPSSPPVSSAVPAPSVAPRLTVLTHQRDGDTLVHDAALDHGGYVRLWSVRTGTWRTFQADRVRAHLARVREADAWATACAAYRAHAAAHAPPPPAAPARAPGDADDDAGATRRVRVVPRRAPDTAGDVRARARRQAARPAEAHPLDPDDPGHAAALRALDRREPLLVTGRAGTGKSTFLRALVAEERARGAALDGGARDAASDARGVVVLAPTGLAALNAGGQTIHAFLGLGARVPTAHDDGADAMPRARRALLAAVDLLVVDEASMVRADLLDALDRAMRVARDRHRPFGGARLLLVGDPWQLPPVVPEGDAEVLAALGYPTAAHVFDAHALRDPAGAPRLRLVEFTRVHRQRDPRWLALLDAVRDGAPDAKTLAALNARVAPLRAGDDAIVLCARRGRATELNAARLDALGGASRVLAGHRSGDWMPWEATPAPAELALAPGARVMCVRNDPDGAWVNGSLGTVAGFRGDRVEVDLDAGGRVRVGRVTWERVRHVLDASTGRIETEVAGRFTQHPLALAWATTIHKAQGLTLDRVHLDLGRGAFAPGQSYVALSRCRTLEGVTLERPITAADVTTDPRVVEFARTCWRAE